MRVDVRGNNRVTDCCYFPGKSVTTASDKHQINFRVLLLPSITLYAFCKNGVINA